MSRARTSRSRRRIASPILATCLLCAAVAAAMPGLTRVPVREVRIHGAFDRVAKEDIQALVTPHLGWGWVRLPADRLRGQLESLRWVAAAEVRREWPLNLSIEIAERRPVARWGEEGLLDQSAAIFDPGDAINRALPMLRGPGGAEEQVLKRYRDFSRRLGDMSLALDALSLDARGGWTLQLRNGPLLRLGAEYVDRRFDTALLVLENLPREAGRELARVDLRYPNGFAVAWRPSGTHQPRQGGDSP